ncbi:MAG: hypothetical protein ACRER8_04370 [Pseudomonas sp.]|uniref:hypothetical protein n=1 Tax=Pseudomonas sp. TaxID=306 RepID=UPI003D6F628F
MVTIKVPQALVPSLLTVMYRSALCKKSTYDGNFIRTDVEGHHAITVEPKPYDDTGLYQIKLAMDGGGACKWRLSNVTLGVIYKQPEAFGEALSFGMGGGVIVVFDHNNAQHGGYGIKVDGDLFLAEDYYPWIDEEFVGGYRKTINLAGRARTYLTYVAPRARSVYIAPKLHSDFLLRSRAPKTNRDGDFTIYHYPDGSVYSDGKWHPNFSRLQSIRKKADAAK